MTDLMAMEKVIIPKSFIKNSSVDFNNKNLEMVNTTKNYMFGEFQLMTIKPNKKVKLIRFMSSKKSLKKPTITKHLTSTPSCVFLRNWKILIIFFLITVLRVKVAFFRKSLSNSRSTINTKVSFNFSDLSQKNLDANAPHRPKFDASFIDRFTNLVQKIP